jgi:hypothetical protein
MLLVVLLVAVGIGVFAYGAVSSVSLGQQQEAATRLAMTQVKNALIGWSAARTPTGALPNARPGELPCPDMSNDGFEDGTCVAGAIGRVPWKTLGIPEPKDGAGETLWYAIAGPFRIFNVNGDPIHSDTKGNLTVYQDSTASAMTTEAIAVLFAPGAALGAQIRDTSAALCPTTGTTIARSLCAANYLETAATVNNSTISGPFILAQSSDTFNDKVMAITTSDLMPIVEQRVAREVRTILQNYKTATGIQGYNGGAGIYPWVDCSNGGSDPGDNRGRIPFQTASPVDWNSGIPATPTLPNWFTNQGSTTQNWAWVIYYAVGRNFLENFGATCTMCEVGQTSLSVNGVWGTEVALITTGPAGANRPQSFIGSGICDQPQWAAYLEDPENNDLANDRFVSPSSTAFARDRLYTIP